MSKLFDKTLGALGASANMRQLRHSITSANIANAETPGYKAKKVDFEQALQRAVDLEGFGNLTTSHGDHFSVGGGSIANARPDVYDNPDIALSNDGNTVDLEKEMATMKENTLMYRAAIQLINKKLAQLKYAASDGGRN
jgi:flagellar basal-body rod protein FlgB